MIRHSLAGLVASIVFATSALAADPQRQANPAPLRPAPAIYTTDHNALRERSLGVLERQFDQFRVAAAALADASVGFCDGQIDRTRYLEGLRATWQAWAPLDAYQFGPIIQRGAVLSVGFWPDKKDYVGRGLRALLNQHPEALRAPQTIAQHSAAVQGLPAIERLLFDDMPACPAVIGISAHLQIMADTLYTDWFQDGGWADMAREAGPDNPVYLSADEFTKTLYTAIDFELTRIADARLGRPLGTFDTPRPAQAEAWRAGLSLDIINAQLEGIETLLVRGFAGAVFNPHLNWVQNVIDDTQDRVASISAPLDVAVADPSTRIRVEGLQTKIRFLQLQFAEDIGPGLGVDTGFTAADGD